MPRHHIRSVWAVMISTVWPSFRGSSLAELAGRALTTLASLASSSLPLVAIVRPHTVRVIEAAIFSRICFYVYSQAAVAENAVQLFQEDE